MGLEVESFRFQYLIRSYTTGQTCWMLSYIRGKSRIMCFWLKCSFPDQFMCWTRLMQPHFKWRRTALPTEPNWTGFPPWTESLLCSCVTWPQHPSSEHCPPTPIHAHTHTGGGNIKPQQREGAAVSLHNVLARTLLIFLSVLESMAMKQQKSQKQAKWEKNLLFIYLNALAKCWVKPEVDGLSSCVCGLKTSNIRYIV